MRVKDRRVGAAARLPAVILLLEEARKWMVRTWWNREEGAR